MRSMTILGLVLSFATAPLTAHAQDSRLRDSIESTTPDRAEQINDLEVKILNSVFTVETLEKDLATANSDRNGSIVIGAASLGAVATSATLVLTAIFGKNLSGSTRTIILLPSMYLGLAGSLSAHHQYDRFTLTQAQVDELKAALSGAKAELKGLLEQLNAIN